MGNVYSAGKDWDGSLRVARCRKATYSIVVDTNLCILAHAVVALRQWCIGWVGQSDKTQTTVSLMNLILVLLDIYM